MPGMAGRAGTTGRPYQHGLPHTAVTNAYTHHVPHLPPIPAYVRVRLHAPSLPTPLPLPRTFAAPLNLVGYFLRMLRAGILRVFGPSQLLSQNGADDLLHSTRREPVRRVE